jgi:hypothetical protein
MLSDDDVEAAIGAGLITQTQADAMQALAASRRQSIASARADEERFHFMRGFNDFFFALGVALIGIGLLAFAAIVQSRVIYGIAAVAMWGLAELLVRRMRLVLPGIVIAVFFVCFTVRAVPFAGWTVTPEQAIWESPLALPLAVFFHGSPVATAIDGVVAAFAAAVFYARLRFPFALLILAGGAVLAVTSAALELWPDRQHTSSLVVLACGLAVFAAAMRFDMSDRLRATRRADCAFWLHVMAAPLLVHSLIRLTAGSVFTLNAVSASAIVAITLAVTAVAVVIDRRALLVSALTYLGSAIAYALSHARVDGVSTSITTLVVLGFFILALGIGWAPLRRKLTSGLSPGLVARLPPVAAA